LLAAVFLLAAQALFGQSGASVPAAVEIQNLEKQISRQGVTGAERHDALVRLARLRQLSGDLEAAAKTWLEAAAAVENQVDDEALLFCAYCLAAMGEWDRACAALRPLLPENPRALFLDACIYAWSSGDISVLAALADNPGFSELKSEIYYTLWKTAAAGSSPLAAAWKQRLLDEFPQSPEGRIAASKSPSAQKAVSARPSPLWLLLPGRGSFALTETGPSGVTQAAVPAPSGPPPENNTRLQTGLFSSEKNAQGQMASLAKAGFSPSIQRRNSNGSELWAVTVPAGQDVNRSIRELRAAGFESFPLK
jgi:tetratricopeptide (TPR) repeat protein